MSPSIKRILALKSLAGTVEDFNGEKIMAEEAARKFCLERFRTLSARLKSLVAWHGKSGVAVRDYPSADELAALEGSCGGRPSIEVADWRMDGSNFSLIDRKATVMIKSALDRKLWLEPEARSRKGEASHPAAYVCPFPCRPDGARRPGRRRR
jgi:hypothetical protein